MIAKPAFLYRHYDKNDALLYVGVSGSPEHRLHTKWALNSVRMTTKQFNNRHDALEAEKLAVLKEQPVYNIRLKKANREGKKAISGFFSPDAAKQLKQIALNEDSTVQALLTEALNDLFIKHNHKPIA